MENIDILIMYPDGNLEGMADRARKINEDDYIRYVVIDFRRVGKLGFNDTREMIDAYSMLKKTKVLYFCTLGDENRDPHKTLKAMGIIKLEGINIRESLEEAVAELLQQNT